MSEDKVPRFLQQTTSQLLHQQEALRKRREMLERESKKPPAMRFGTRSPPRSHSRHGKSPAPPSSSSLSDRAASHSAAPSSDNVHRELNWSRTDDETVSERAPMRFSMTFRPAPTPLTTGKARGAMAAGHHLPSSPSPREVNTSDQSRSASRKAARDPSTPRTPSPRSPPPQRIRADVAAVENLPTKERSADVPAQSVVPVFTHRENEEAELLHLKATEEKDEKSVVEEKVVENEENVNGVMASVPEVDVEEEEKTEMTRWEKRQSLSPPPPFPKQSVTPPKTNKEEREAESDVAGIAGFSNNFPVPRFTPSTPLASRRTKANVDDAKPTTEAEGPAEEAEAVTTPGRPAVGEFQTPRPVTRMSAAYSLTPVVHDSAVKVVATAVETEDVHEEIVEVQGGVTLDDVNTEYVAVTEEVEQHLVSVHQTRSTASPAPTASQILTCMEASTEKRRGTQQTPAMSRDHGSEVNPSKPSSPSLSRLDDDTSVSRSLDMQTPSPTRRTKASPAPTAQDLIHSVQASSADRRPCGCERPTPSPETWHRHRTPTSSARGTAPSPTPVPVPPSSTPMTDFASVTHRCCDRPTPASMSSQPAGGEARATAAPSSSSPWPTTENIISSILAGTQEEQRRAREESQSSPHDEPDESEPQRYTTDQHDSDELPRRGAVELTSPTAVHPHEEEKDEEGGHSGVASMGRVVGTVTHTPSPVPTERQYGESVLASAERRRCGRPTPAEREVSQGKHDSCGAIADTAGTSASPQPSTHHLLDSLDVSIGKTGTREKPVPRTQESDEDEEENAVDSRAHDRDDAEDGQRNSGVESSATPAAAVATVEEEEQQQQRQRQSSFQRSLRTPSPTPTPEHVVASLQASAEKRTRSPAVDKANESSNLSRKQSSSEYSPRSNSFQSPTLTAQNVKDSIQKLVADKQQQTRSDAQEPQRPWGESRRRVSEAQRNASASPGVTAEDVDTSLATLEQDQRRQDRSARAAPVSNPLSPFSAEEVNSSVGEGGSEKAASTTPGVASPGVTDFVTQSAMFFDCVSVPVTPSAPTVDAVVAAEAEATAAKKTSHVPAQFLELQQTITAISEGRSRTRTPPPLHASEARSPAPVKEEDTPRAEASMELPEELSTEETALINEEKSGEDEMGRRSSLVLVEPTRGHQALLQHPHEPAPVMPPPTISPVRVPRTPTPPPPRRHPMLSKHDGEGENGESPLPRPVPLHTQVSVAHKSASRLKPTLSRSPPTVWTTTAVDEEKPTPVLQATSRQRSAALAEADAEEEEEDVFDARNDWMDLVEPLRPHTMTVSPRAGAVVLMSHSLPREARRVSVAVATDAIDANDDVAAEQLPPTPPQTRKRSRSAVAMTPASVVLTADDGASTGDKSSQDGRVPQTPSSPTPRSSTRGRRSQAEELLAMLPADVVAEVRRIEEQQEQDVEEREGEGEDVETVSESARPSAGSPASRLSGLSDVDSTVAQSSSISHRVTQRPPRVYRTQDDYIQYLEGIARESATKTRKAAGRRMRKIYKKDITENAGKPPSAATSPARSSRGSRSNSDAHVSASPSRSPHSSTDVSPLTPSPSAARRQSKLRVSTRLSAEVQQALFRDSPAPKAAPVDASSTATKKTKKLAATGSPKPRKSAKPSPKSSPKPSAKKAMAEKVKNTEAVAQKSRKAKKVRKFVTAKALRMVTHKSKTGKK